MGNVNLLFDVYKNGISINSKINYDLIRLKSGLKLKTKKGFSDIYSAIVDTGAHISLLPLSIWKEAECEKLGECKLSGVSDENGFILVDVGKINYFLTDNIGNKTKEMSMFAFLAHTDKVPLILGFKDALDKLGIHFNFNKNMAYAEEV